MRTGVGETAGGRRALGELASGASAVAAALRARGIPEDVEVAAFLERLSGAARMHLAGVGERGQVADLFGEDR